MSNKTRGAFNHFNFYQTITDIDIQVHNKGKKEFIYGQYTRTSEYEKKRKEKKRKENKIKEEFL